MKMPLLLTPSSSLRKPSCPPTQVRMEDRTGLRQTLQPLLFRTMVWITLGKRTPRRENATEATSCVKEVSCGDYTYGLAKGSTTYGSLWGRLSQPGVISIHSRDGRRSLPGKDTGSPWGETYHGRIHMWDHPKGNHNTRAPRPAQGLTLGKHTSVGPGIWHSTTPDCRGWRRNFKNVCQRELNWQAVKTHVSGP